MQENIQRQQTSTTTTSRGRKVRLLHQEGLRGDLLGLPTPKLKTIGARLVRRGYERLGRAKEEEEGRQRRKGRSGQ